MTTKTVKLSLAIALVTLSGLSQATSAWHQGNGDIVHFTPEHIGQNTAKSRVDPNVHAKMLPGDSMSPEIVDKTNTGAQTSQSRQQVLDDKNGQLKNLYIN